MALSSVSVIGNVLRLRTVEFRDSIREHGT
jgi:hypothetical protein